MSGLRPLPLAGGARDGEAGPGVGGREAAATRSPTPGPSRKREGSFLVVTADDFGNDVAVNEAVEQAHTDGILTAASLMVAAPAAADAVARAKRLPRLGVGLHLTLVDSTPLLPPEQVPGLVDARGRFRDDMAAAGARMFFLPAVRRQLAAEIAAQFAAFAATGLPLDHVNAHKHFHLHPTIAGLILKIGARYGLKAVRAPIEPGAPSLTDPWARLVARRFRRRGVAVPDAVFGLRHSGHMTAERLRAAIDRLPPGLSEIYVHPATRDDYPGHGPAYRHRAELAALTDPAIAAQIAARGVTTGSFAALGG
ncbi:MAG: hopanoid biosynthesis-associated protein HpnK [Sphingomonadaceae bacterium]|nr:hopanoid biosynthesis-associated protein HpnK [Sphingomonadaceae bacterium]